ncbi:MAG TPA: MarR family transcriptional regulator [Mycobacteriales bacterium]|jgi:DNA-binding MarR family transcriptional regulator|nr:MarR family transcriptional regulator [Mycobacteriales bacterium]
MQPRASPGYRFGDLLALARQDWVRQMSAELLRAGYADYRITDAAVMRLLLQGPLSVGEVAAGLGVTRQAARKIGRGLEVRGYVLAAPDPDDARRLNATLTPDGATYAGRITTAISRLNRRVVARTAPDDLTAIDAMLRSIITDQDIRRRASRIPPPGQAAINDQSPQARRSAATAAPRPFQ